MGRKTHIEPWLSEVELLGWLRRAQSRAEYQRRLAVWLTYLRRFPAHEVATLLGVSTQVVWLWIGQYNRLGPAGLQRKGRGGRRWACRGSTPRPCRSSCDIPPRSSATRSA